ncbi:MAG: aminoglycoside phosphotransferase family protein [Chlamydiota bacterium]
MDACNITPELAKHLIQAQFPEYGALAVSSVETQGHDNRTYRLGDDLLIRMPIDANYALKVPQEQKFLPRLAKKVRMPIPQPIKMGGPSEQYPYPFSIYKWLEGRSADQETVDDRALETIAVSLANFLQELQGITDIEGPCPGQHNWWRGDPVRVYDQEARTQIAHLSGKIDSRRALQLWERACSTQRKKKPVWIHGDFAASNILIQNRKVSGIIDFGGMAMGDPACDLVIAWTYLKGNARELFIREMDLDKDTWLRAQAWALWKATFTLLRLVDEESYEASLEKKLIEEILDAAFL